MSFFINKVLVLEILGNFFESFGVKNNKKLFLSVKILASVLSIASSDVIRKKLKVVSDNDAALEEKPEVRETDLIDKTLNLGKWKGKRHADEHPIFRDCIEIDQMKEAVNMKFLDTIADAMMSLADSVYEKYFPVYNRYKTVKEKEFQKRKTARANTLKLSVLKRSQTKTEQELSASLPNPEAPQEEASKPAEG